MPLHSLLSICLLSSFAWEELLRFRVAVRGVVFSAGSSTAETTHTGSRLSNPFVQDNLVNSSPTDFLTRLLQRLVLPRLPVLAQHQFSHEYDSSSSSFSAASGSSLTSTVSSPSSSLAVSTSASPASAAVLPLSSHGSASSSFSFEKICDSLVDSFHSIFAAHSLLHPSLYFLHQSFRLSLSAVMSNPAVLSGQLLSSHRTSSSSSSSSSSFLNLGAVKSSLCSLLDEINAMLRLEDECSLQLSNLASSSPAPVSFASSSMLSSSSSELPSLSISPSSNSRASSLSVFLLHLKVLTLHDLSQVVGQSALAQRRRQLLDRFYSNQVFCFLFELQL